MVSANSEENREEAKHGGCVLDEVEIPLPQCEPRDECDGQRPRWNPDTGAKLDCECNAANFGDENEKDDQRNAAEYDREEAEAESVAQSFDHGVPADRGKTTRHLQHEAKAGHAQEKRPHELVLESGAGLRGCRDRTDFKKSPDSCNESEGELHDFLHAPSGLPGDCDRGK